MSEKALGSEAVLQHLSQLEIEFELYSHAPVAVAADRYPMDLVFGAQVCKNLLITTRNENRFLLIMIPFEKNVDLKVLRDAFSTSRLCFASDQALYRLLGQESGAVGVCGVINDKEQTVEVVFDSALQGMERVAMHPCVNDKTIVMPFESLLNYVRSCGNTVHFHDF